jgi:protein-tyrosine-phosphatase
MSDDRAELTTEQIVLIRQGAQRLHRQFDGTFDLPTIERYLDDSRALLQTTATFTQWFPLLVERLTRDRLRALQRLELGADAKPAVLFLCVHNAGRSQMAAGWMRRLAGDRIDVFSGGTEPADAMNAAVVEAMSEVGIDIAAELPQPWTDEIARTADVIVSMGCGDARPVTPGTRYEEWDLPSPSGQSIETVREIRDDVRTRVEQLIVSLDHEMATARSER